MLKYFTLLFLLSLSFFVQAQDFILKGRVIDSKTKKPLAFVNVLADDSQTGATTDIDGKFIIQTKKNVQSLTLTYVGYKPLNFNVLGENYQKPFTIELESQTFDLSEVVILPGENPAHRIMRKVYENRKKNNPENLRAFTYNSYNKFVFKSDTNKTKPLADSIEFKPKPNGNVGIRIEESENPNDSIDDMNLKEFLDKSYLFLTETVTKRKYISPNLSNEEVLATKISGISSPLFTMLATQMQSFSFYNNYITILDNSYLNPVSKGSTHYYLFQIEDTNFVAKDSVFIISFRPRKGRNFDGLKGIIYINTNGYALQNVIAEPFEEQADMMVKIQQKYAFIDQKQWFPVQLNTDLIYKSVNVEGNFLLAEGKSYLKEIEIDPPLKRRRLGINGLEIANDAMKSETDEFWDAYRPDSLTQKELNTYRIIDSLAKEVKLDAKIKFVEALITGKIPLGPIDFHLKHLMGYNDYEGFRLGAGLSTNDKVSKWFSLGGYYAYGFKDKASKYGGNLDFYFDKRKNFTLQFLYKNDLQEAGTYDFTRLGSNWITDNTRNLYIRNFDKIDFQSVNFKFQTTKYLSGKIALNHYQKKFIEANDYQFSFLNDELQVENIQDFRVTELNLQFRYAFRQEYIRTQNRLIPLASKYPIFWFNIARPIDLGLPNDFNFTRISAKLQQTFLIKNLGKTTFQIVGGWADGKMPASQQFFGRGTSSKNLSIYVPLAFQTMQSNEFLTSRFVNVFLFHDFKSLLLKNEKFEPQIKILTNFAIGDLQNPANHQSLLGEKKRFKTLDKGFWESGLIIDNLVKSTFSSIGVGFFYRYGAYALDKFGDNATVKFTFSTSF